MAITLNRAFFILSCCCAAAVLYKKGIRVSRYNDVIFISVKLTSGGFIFLKISLPGRLLSCSSYGGAAARRVAVVGGSPARAGKKVLQFKMQSIFYECFCGKKSPYCFLDAGTIVA